MPFSSDIHTVTYLSKGCADVLGWLFCGLQRPAGGSAGAVVNCGGASGYYGELMGIKGLNWLSKHLINREWAAACISEFVGLQSAAWARIEEEVFEI